MGHLGVEIAKEHPIRGPTSGGDLGIKFFDAGELQAAHGPRQRLVDAMIGNVEAVMLLQRLAPLLDDAFALVDALTRAFEIALDLAAGTAGLGRIQPDLGRPWRQRIVLEFDQVQMMEHRGRFRDLTVDIEARTAVGQLRMDVVGVVDDSAAPGKLEEMTVGAEDIEDFGQRSQRCGHDLGEPLFCPLPPAIRRRPHEMPARHERSQPPPVDLVHLVGNDTHIHPAPPRTASGRLLDLFNRLMKRHVFQICRHHDRGGNAAIAVDASGADIVGQRMLDRHKEPVDRVECLITVSLLRHQNLQQRHLPDTLCGKHTVRRVKTMCLCVLCTKDSIRQ